MPTPTIPAGNLYMNAVTYTGTVASIATTFSPDLFWAKTRNNVWSHGLFDSLRGQAVLLPDTVAGDAFSIDALNLGDGSNSVGLVNYSGYTNQPSYPYVAWYWKAGGSTAVTNTSGTISSQVSANTTSGFSVVTYTGTGATATVGHGLGVAPSMIIIKSRVTSYNWAIWHKSLGGGDYALQLNTDIGATNAFDYWNGDPTDTRFTLGTDFGSNKSAETYVAYCWAEVAGFSKFGFWSGNSSTDGPFVYLGFRPRFILFKRSSGDGNNWRITDTSRSTSNPNTTAFLYPDIDVVENSNANDSMDILSNGFKLRATAQASNETGSTYIYMAFAENPFKYANAR